MEQILEGVPEDHPHVRTCPKCRRLWEAARSLRNLLNGERKHFQEFMGLTRQSTTAGALLTQIEALPPEGRLPWILQHGLSTPSLALRLAARGRGVIHRSPTQTAQWQTLAEAVFNAAPRDPAPWAAKDAEWVSGRLRTLKGSLCLVRGHIKEAHAHFERAREIFLDLGDEFQAALLAEGFAQTLTKTGKPREAKRLCLETLPILRAYGERRNYLRLMTALSLVLYAMGAVEKPLRISGLLTKITDIDDESRVCFLRNHALLFFELKRFDEVERILGEITAVADKARLDMETARCLWLYGEIALERGAFREAEADLEKAKGIFRREGDLLDAALCDAYLARAYVLAGRPRKALAVLPGVIAFLTQENILLHISKALSLWRDALDADDPRSEAIGDQAYRLVARHDKIPLAYPPELILN
jgi:tetratricopeptide (TPR) repeat protein